LATRKRITIFTEPLQKWRFFNLKICAKMNKTTTKVKLLLQKNTQEEVSVMIGISRNTLLKRLQKDDWKVSEISHIQKL